MSLKESSDGSNEKNLENIKLKSLPSELKIKMNEIQNIR